MSYIHYKFRSAKDYDSILIDGMGLSAFDLKREIIRRKKLKGEDFDLILSNAESGDEYKDDAAIIARNSSIVVRRTPVPDAKRKGILAGTAKYPIDDLHVHGFTNFSRTTLPSASNPSLGPPTFSTSNNKGVSELVPVHLPTETTSFFNSSQSHFTLNALNSGGIPGLSNQFSGNGLNTIPGLGPELMDEKLAGLNQLDEEDQLNAMFQATKYHWEATQEKMAGLKRIRPTHYHPPSTTTLNNTSTSSHFPNAATSLKQPLVPPRPPPPGYVCYRCGVKGHFIQDCPTNGDATFDRPKVKRTTGIPKSFLKEITTPSNQGLPQDTSSVMMNAEGKIVQFVSNEAAWKKIQNQMTVAVTNEEEILETASIPSEFKCKLCKKIMRDAVSISCCQSTFCDECILSSLTSEGPNRMVCPECRSTAFPDHLQPHVALRTRISKFLRELAQRKAADLRSSSTPPLPPTLMPAPSTTVFIKVAPSSLESRITIRSDKFVPGLGSIGASTPPTLANSKIPTRVAEGLAELGDLMKKRRLGEENAPPAKKVHL